MLTTLAHAGQPLAPHDLWTAWDLDPILLTLLAAAAWSYRRGYATAPRAADVRRARAFAAAVVTLAVALLSPLAPLSGALASAHMVQHLLLVLVAGPLLAFSAPVSAILRGSPLPVRRARGRVRRGLGLRATSLHVPSHPAVVWLAHVGTLWFWHSAGAYDAAVGNEVVHVLEHATFLITAALFWRVLIGGRRSGRVPAGLALLLVFGVGMASVFLALLLTFASEPWYASYAASTAAWGLDPLADQQLAGALMWIPASAVYVGAALALLRSWIASTEEPRTTPL